MGTIVCFEDCKDTQNFLPCNIFVEKCDVLLEKTVQEKKMGRNRNIDFFIIFVLTDIYTPELRQTYKQA